MSSYCGTAKMRRTRNHEVACSILGLTGLRIWHCHEQLRLRSGIAVALAQAGGNSSDQTPILENAKWRGCGTKKTKKKKKNSIGGKKRGRNEGRKKERDIIKIGFWSKKKISIMHKIYLQLLVCHISVAYSKEPIDELLGFIQ